MKHDTARETYDGSTPTRAVGGAISIMMLTVLHHPDLARVGDCGPLANLTPGRDVLLSREQPSFGPPGGARAKPLEDACVSRTPLRLQALPGGAVRIVVGESRTSVVHRGAVLKDAVELSSDELENGVVLRLGGRIVVLLHRARVSDLPGGDPFGLVGESPGMHRVRSHIRRIASMDAPVLIRGETGTGKELVARAIHDASPRRDKPFVSVNLAAVPSGLAGSELFGAERGAFTGSVKPQPGYFRNAQGGTLFLDEIGEASTGVQAMLLRALESGEVQTVGSQRVQTADVRILAATDADLEAKIKDGGFRAPLLHRLAAYEIHIPPLRERRDDIGRLLVRFLEEELARVGASHRLGSEWLPASVVARLAALDWPGNVRQLRNVVRQLVISNFEQDRIVLSQAVEHLLEEAAMRRVGDDVVTVDPEVPRGGRSSAVPAPPGVASGETLMPPPLDAPRPRAAAVTRSRKPAEVSQAEVSDALRRTRWDIAAAAEQLGISRASLYVLMERDPSIRTARDLSTEEIFSAHEECGGDLGRMVERLEVSEKALRRRVRELGLSTG